MRPSLTVHSPHRAPPTGRTTNEPSICASICCGLTAWPRIGRGDDAVDLQLPVGADRDLGARGDVAAVAHDLGEAAIHAGGAGLPQPARSATALSTAEMLRAVRHQLAPERQRVLAGGMRELVDEALDVDRVVVDVHAAPEARRHVRVAHRVIDQQVRNRVAEMAFRAARR